MQTAGQVAKYLQIEFTDLRRMFREAGVEISAGTQVLTKADTLKVANYAARVLLAKLVNTTRDDNEIRKMRVDVARMAKRFEEIEAGTQLVKGDPMRQALSRRLNYITGNQK